jgi:hypothetical protein
MTLPRSGAARPTRFWLEMLERRALRGDDPDLVEPIAWSSDAEHRAAVKFFNAALRAEESGLRQAHELADEVNGWDPELGEVLRLYGDEEGWHRRLLEEFLANIGGTVQPMGPVTRLFYSAYARAKRMETIVLTNLMFETIGATTYRMALRNVRHAAARRMLTVLARDESFHVPLNVHFLREVLKRQPGAKRRLRVVHTLLFWSLLLLPFASRPKARAFDGLDRLELVRAYAQALGGLFVNDPELGLSMPRWATLLFGRAPAPSPNS